MRGADQRRTDALARLIQAGADVHRENIEGTTALMIALKAGSEPAATALMDAGADPRRANLHGLSALSAAKRMPAGPARELVIQRARMLDEREALSQASGAAPSPPRSAQSVRTL